MGIVEGGYLSASAIKRTEETGIRTSLGLIRATISSTGGSPAAYPFCKFIRPMLNGRHQYFTLDLS
jgi:hypothetical protein